MNTETSNIVKVVFFAGFSIQPPAPEPEELRIESSAARSAGPAACSAGAAACSAPSTNSA